ASSISHYPQGFAQNEPATGAYSKAIREGRLSTKRGHLFSYEDRWRSRMIEALMCDFRIDANEMRERFNFDKAELSALFAPIRHIFGQMVQIDCDGNLSIPVKARPLTRMIARQLDGYDMSETGHSTAI
ncbi:MAG: coproporphyrinogen III oxidase, partial [Paracoccus sp. (in: a-proteobacteria)]